MLDDPRGLAGSNWNDVHIWLTLLWIYFPLIITFAFTMLIAHAFIPSLVSTRHLPPKANKVRLPLTVFALVVLVAAAVIMGVAMNQTLSVGEFWDRFLF